MPYMDTEQYILMKNQAGLRVLIYRLAGTDI